MFEGVTAEVVPGLDIRDEVLDSNLASLSYNWPTTWTVQGVRIVAPTLSRNTTYPGAASVAYRPVVVGASYPGGSVKDCRIISPVYAGGAVEGVAIGGTPQAEDMLSFGWRLDVTVRDSAGAPVTGAAVAVKDTAGAVNSTGTTDASGLAAGLDVLTSRYAGSRLIRSDRSPHTVEVSADGQPVITQSIGTLTADGSLAMAVAGGVVTVHGSAVLHGSASLTARAVTHWRFKVIDPIPY